MLTKEFPGQINRGDVVTLTGNGQSCLQFTLTVIPKDRVSKTIEARLPMLVLVKAEFVHVQLAFVLFNVVFAVPQLV